MVYGHRNRSPKLTDCDRFLGKQVISRLVVVLNHHNIYTMFWAVMSIMIRVVSWVTTGSLRTLYHPQDGPPSPCPISPRPFPNFGLHPDLVVYSWVFEPPLPQLPRARATFPHRARYRFAPFEGLILIFRRAAGVSALRDSVTHPRSVSTLLSKGLRWGYLYTSPLHTSHGESAYTLS